MKLIIKWLLYALSILATAYLLPGVYVDGVITALKVALVLSLLNVTLKPVLIILTIPVTILTLGLFLLVINAIVILFVDYFFAGFGVDSFLWAVGFSIILSLFYAILNGIFGND